MQAARGTSLSPADSDKSATRPVRRTRYLLLFGLLFLVGYLLDQGSKYLAVEHLTGRPPVPVVGEILQLRLVYNPGAAFGLGGGFTQVISVVAIAATIVVLVLAARVRNLLWAGTLGILLAGVAGNLTDRLFRDPGPLQGHVVDMFMLPRWPVFNVADICIDIAFVLVLVQVFRGIRLDGTREPATAKPRRRMRKETT